MADTPARSARNSSAELLRKAVQDAAPGRPTWTQIALTDREQALCGVIDHYVRLHLGERDRLSAELRATKARTDALEQRLAAAERRAPRGDWA